MTVKAKVKLYEVVSVGRHTGSETVFGPYTKDDADRCLIRVNAAKSTHTRRFIREVR